MAHTNRVIVLIDMDCFYCQVEEKLDPSLKGKPIAVVQYNAWRGGGIIAVNYPAREMGVTRHMRGDDAKQKCPEIVLVRVPQVRGKADLTKYREAGKRVAEVLQTFTSLLERASIDEAYLDITKLVKKKINAVTDRLVTVDKIQNTFVVGYDRENFLDNLELSESNYILAVGGAIVEDIRKKVLEETGYECSAGIAHNKILAKLVCGLHKPNKQTLLPQDSVSKLYEDLSIKKIKSLGGKFGDVLSEELQISNMGELMQFSEKELIRRFDEKNGKWLFNIARGIDLDPVTRRLVSKSIGCCKRFPGKNCLTTHDNIVHWLNELSSEISERLVNDMEENNRRAKQMVISFAQRENKKEVSSSRTRPLNCYEQSRIANASIEVIKKLCQKSDGSYNITFLGISVGNFDDLKSTMNITSFFKTVNSSDISLQEQTFETDISNMGKTITCQANVLENLAIFPNAKVQNTFEHIENNTVIDDMHNHFNVEDQPENISIYSASTDELDEEPKNYIYYEDIYPESISRMPLSETLKGAQNPSDELVLEDTDSLDRNHELEIRRNMTIGSFFNKYFDRSNESSISSPIPEPRVANLIEGNEGALENDTFFAETTNDIKQSQQEYVNSYRQICPKCNKKIVCSDMQLHMDYHFALEMVKKEAHLYTHHLHNKKVLENLKETKNCVTKYITETKPISKYFQNGMTSNPNKNICNEKIKSFSQSSCNEGEGENIGQCDLPKNIGKGVKRKAILAKPISSFFAKLEKLDEQNSKYCSECNKRIPLDDFIFHSDYHVAKRIHTEINESRPDNENSSKKVEVKEKGNAMNITKFFKNL